MKQSISAIHDDLELLIGRFTSHFVKKGNYIYPQFEQSNGLAMLGELCRLSGRIAVLKELETLFAEQLDADEVVAQQSA